VAEIITRQLKRSLHSFKSHKTRPSRMVARPEGKIKLVIRII